MTKEREQKQADDMLARVLKKIANAKESTDLRSFKEELIISAQKRLEQFSPRNSFSDHDKDHFQVIDFFCGCGGLSLGFKNLPEKYHMLGGCDIVPDALNSYRLNIGAPGIAQDIRELLDDKTLNQFIKKLDGYDKKKPLIIIGGPPCQGFSSHRKKNWSKEDERNDLLATYVSVAIKLKPVCVIIENVPDILSKKYWPYFQKTKEILEKAGYKVHQKIHNAASFGVPQERFRTIVVAMKKDFLLPEPLLESNNYLTVRDAIGSLPKIEAGEVCINDEYHVSANHQPSTLDTIRKIPKDGGSRPKGIGPKCLDKVNGFSDVYGRLSWDKPSITITQYARNPASGRYVHPEQDRGLTIREAASLQSFPTGFIFTGTFDSKFKQIGEAVPPKLACAIASNALIELSVENSPKPMAAKLETDDEQISNSFSSVIAGIKTARSRCEI